MHLDLCPQSAFPLSNTKNAKKFFGNLVQTSNIGVHILTE